jgi:endoglucanase
MSRLRFNLFHPPRDCPRAPSARSTDEKGSLPRCRAWRVLGVAMAAAGSLVAATACSGSSAATTRLYSYPGNLLFAAAALLRDNGHKAEAAELEAVAETPSGIWAAGQPGEMQEVSQVTLAANQAHAIPVIVAYNLPGRDACGKLSASDGPTASAYEKWVNQLAAAIGTGDDIVIVEPDGLPDAVRGCLSQAQSSVRFQLLRYAMRKLGGLPHARIYLDAGNPGMFQDPSRLAQPLEKAGIRYGRGFSANVSNFHWTADVVTWSQRLERALGGRLGAVIDTSRNGRGPYTGPDNPQWCNPPGRALGPAPRLDPGPAGIDAYLWVKDPGASDGPCNGGPSPGQYWPQYAVELAQASHSPRR